MGSRTKELEKKKATPGPKPQQVTEEDKGKVVAFVQMGLDQQKIAKLMRMSINTLRKHFEYELEHGLKDRHSIVQGKLMQKINNGCTASIIFYLKTQCGWKETNVQELTLPQINLIEQDMTNDKNA